MPKYNVALTFAGIYSKLPQAKNSIPRVSEKGVIPG